MKKVILVLMLVLSSLILFTGCGETIVQPSSQQQERAVAAYVGDRLRETQPIPTDIMASLERHNLIRRSYWINGMRERAINLPNPVPNPPLAQIVLLTESGAVVGTFMVEGKVTSLNYSLVPYSDYWEAGHDLAGTQGGTRQRNNRWIANPGGVYGTNTNGIFFFTPDGKYVEWNGIYLFTDVPLRLDAPVVVIDYAGGN